MDQSSCSACGGQLHQLPMPHAGRAMLSDGRVLNTALRKASCLSCGLVSHIEQPTGQAIKEMYGEEYSLATASPVADQSRAAAYAKILQEAVTPGHRILEVGCGSGALLRELLALWPDASLVGIDPAVPETAPRNAKIRLERGFFEDYSAGDAPFDLIVSINVIEHVTNPRDFFKRSAALLAPGGQLAVFCPASLPVNLELVFYDHLHTFTPDALASLASECGFSLKGQTDCLAIGAFQLAVFSRITGKPARDPVFTVEAADTLAIQRAQYLQAWSSLEKNLMQRVGHASGVVFFGAGQMAALLRAYAPGIWRQVDLLVMDNVGDAWHFEKPVRSYSTERDRLQGATVIIATAPEVQGRLADRLSRDGLDPVRFDDIISH